MQYICGCFNCSTKGLTCITFSSSHHESLVGLRVLQLGGLDAAHVVQVPAKLVIARIFGKRCSQGQCMGLREKKIRITYIHIHTYIHT